MSTFRPEGWHTITPRLVAAHPERLVEFLRHAFGAIGELHEGRPAELRIGDSMIMVSAAEARDAVRAFLYLYVEDADATYARAISTGALSREEPRDTPYGDRRGMVEDPAGNLWQIATRRKSV